MTSDDSRAALSRLIRDEGARVTATLVRLTGDVQLAEDAVQDAAVRALTTWSRDGVPDTPRAWLTVAARNCAVDRIRREGGRDRREAEAMRLQALFDEEPPDHDVPDDLLRLVFTCCHPTLSLDAQVGLSLRTLCGLTTAEVGRALLVPEATMQKRLARAKQKIRQAKIPYRVPSAAELPNALPGSRGACICCSTKGISPVRATIRYAVSWPTRRSGSAGSSTNSCPTSRVDRSAGSDAAAGLTSRCPGRA